VVMISRVYGVLLKEFQTLRSREHTFMVLIAVLIGVLGGFGAIVFRFAIRFAQGIFFGTWHYSLEHVLSLPWYARLAAPALGGLVVGPIVHYFAREARGHGVPEVMESIVLRSGAIRPRVVLAKITASAVSIGSGGSVGREGPIVQIGSALGSTIGQVLRVNQSSLRTMVACGTAAGIAGTFNAPIAGALFAMEVLLSDFGISQFSPIVIASVAATIVSRHFLGDFPAFIVPRYELVSVFEMIPYAVLGALAAFVALAFINLLYATEDVFESLRIPPITKPVLGGALVGAIGIFFPHVFGVGYETIDLALGGNLAWNLLLLLVVLKLVATSITIGSGGSGGIFAPSLFIGACLGGLVGTVVHALEPARTAAPGAYALVGMGAVAAGAMHAPITAILIIFELTDDYRIILPLIVACITSVLITTRLKQDSIYTLKLSRRGVNLVRGQELNVLRSLQVSQVMRSDPEKVHADAAFRTLMDLMVNSPRTNFFVVDNEDRLLGVITLQDLRKAVHESDALETLLVAFDLMRPVHHVFRPSDTLDVVMKAFSETYMDELPVVDGAEEERLVGTITKNDVIDAYNREILKRDMASSLSGYLATVRKCKRVELVDGNMLCEMEVPGSFVNRTLEELDLRRRHGVEVVLIRQAYDPEKGEPLKVLAPKPDYRFRFGDSILVLGSKEAVDRIRD